MTEATAKRRELPREVAPTPDFPIKGCWFGVTINMDAPSQLNPNRLSARKHWGGRAYWRKKYRTAAFKATERVLEQNPTVAKGHVFPKDARLRVTTTIGLAKGRREIDGDNALASCKAAFDGVAEALGVDDRQFEHEPVIQVRDKDGVGWTRIVIELIEEKS